MILERDYLPLPVPPAPARWIRSNGHV